MTTDTTAQTDALLPCPFCGQSERLAEEWKDEDKHPLLLIGCDTRGCPGESREHYLLNGVRERAVAAWNRRALASSPAPLGGADAIVRAIAADSTWRSKDNTLYPRICQYVRNTPQERQEAQGAER